MPRVSILMPTHNRADVIGYAIESVLQQTEPDFELLVVADGCTDETVDLVNRQADRRIRLFDLPKAPHFGYGNRNIALREARGEFVAFAAHDDLLFPDHLALLTQTLETTGREWIYSRPLWVSTDGVVVPYATNLTNTDELQWFLTRGNTIPASCIVFRRSCLERYGFVPENVPSAADWRHSIAIIEGGRRQNVAYLPTPTCLHFSAIWKASRHSGVDEVRTWLEVADTSSWWPTALRYQIPEGWPEQRVLFEAMSAGGAAWAHDVRRAAALAIDRVAWDDLRVIRPQLRADARSDAAAAVETLQRECGRLRLELHEALAEVARRQAQEETATRELRSLNTQLSATLGSTSWRVTAPLRALKRLVTLER